MTAYRTKSVLLNGTAQACSASAVTDVTGTFGVTADESKCFLAKIDFSALAQTTGITVKLQETAEETEPLVWEDVGSEAQAAIVKKTFAGGTAEVTDITWPATAAAAQGDYVHVTGTDGTTYAVWLDIDAAGTAPSGALYTAADQKIKVSIVTAGTAAANGALARAAVVANAAWAADFTTSTLSTATFTITQVLGGAVADPAPKSENDGGAGSITVSVTTPGANGAGINTTTNAITSASHGFTSGQQVIYTAGTRAPGGLTTGTYYVIYTDANTLSLASTQAEALAGTPAVDITDYGTGTQALYQARYEIKILSDDATDAAQLPIWPKARMVVSTGSSDTGTVSAVFIAKRF